MQCLGNSVGQWYCYGSDIMLYDTVSANDYFPCYCSSGCAVVVEKKTVAVP